MILLRPLCVGLLLLFSCHSPGLLAQVEEHIGSAPNLALPTLGGQQLWSDVAWRDGWRVQEHQLTGHHRLLDREDRRRAWGTEAACRRRLHAEAAPEPEGTHLVVLLHGLGRRRGAMADLEEALVADGWRVARLSYASTRAGLPEHAASVQEVLSGLEGVDRVSFVTHSLGGLVARAVLTDREAGWRQELEPAALVQIAPPNQGSLLARRLDLMPLRCLLGPSFAALAAGDELGLTVPAVPTLVIAGGGHDNPLLDGPDDLVVRVAETALPGSEQVVLDGVAHTWLPTDERVLRAVCAFLDGHRPEDGAAQAQPETDPTGR